MNAILETIVRTILGIIAGTPWWVWVLLVLLILRGIKALTPTIIRPYQLFILPMVFIALFFLKNGLVPFRIIVWSGSLVVGSGLGFHIFRNIRILADKNKDLMLLPGTKSTLILVFSIFAINYYFGYKVSVDPQTAKSIFVIATKAILSGLVVGIALGKSLCYLYKYKEAPHTDLT